MGLKINVVVFILTIAVTLSTTALMCMCVVTDYWEIVSYPMTSIEKILNESKLGIGDSISDVSVESLFQEKVTVIKEKTETKQIMIQMHAGLWSICYDVAGNLICFNFRNLFSIVIQNILQTTEISMNLKLCIISLEKEWEYFVQNFTEHVDTVRCLEITQKGFAINTKTIDEEKIIPSNPRQLRKLIENRKSIHFTSVLSPY